MRMKRCLGVLLLLGAAALTHAQSYIEDNYVGVWLDDTTFAMDMGTSSTYPIPNKQLMYGFYGSGSSASTSHLVFNLDGTPMDYNTALAATLGPAVIGSGPGAFIATGRANGSGVTFGAIYTLVTNVLGGLNPDMVQAKYFILNGDVQTHSVGCRWEIDTEVNNNDGANVSVDNGASVILANTLWRAASGNLPSDWWDYDVAPPGVANVVGRGSVKNNP